MNSRSKAPEMCWDKKSSASSKVASFLFSELGFQFSEDAFCPLICNEAAPKYIFREVF